MEIVSQAEKDSFRYKLKQIFKKNKEDDEILEALDELNLTLYPFLDKIAIRVLSMRLFDDYKDGLLDDYFNNKSCLTMKLD